MKILLKWFAQGMIILVPMLATIWVAIAVFSTVDGLIPVDVPGLGFVVTLLLITSIGFLGSTVLKGVVTRLEIFFSRLPLLKILYNAVKDLLEAFAGDNRKFDQPVTVQTAPDSPVKLVGFITQKDLSYLGLEGEVVVYCPHSYNFSGQMVVVPKTLVKPLSADSSFVMSMVVSGGVAGSREDFERNKVAPIKQSPPETI